MIKKRIAILLIMFSLSFVGCDNKSNITPTPLSQASESDKQEATFLGFDVLEYEKSGDSLNPRIQAILVEKDTKVMYYYTSEWRTGKTMVVLLKKDGSPRTYTNTK